MDSISSQFLLPDHIEYLIVNRNLLIVEASPYIQRFAEPDQEVGVNQDIRLGFPELIGVEDYLTALLEETQNRFELKSIQRPLNNHTSLYLNIYARKFQENLVIFLEEVTDKMALEQTLVQSSNEASLLLSALSTSQEYIHKIVSAIAEALLVTTGLGIIKTVNQASQDLFGYSEAELIGQPISLLIQQPELLDQIDCPTTFIYSPEQKLTKHIEANCYTKSGRELIVAFACSKVHADGIELDNFIYLGHDITQRKHAEKLLLESEERYRDLFENAIDLMFEYASDLIQWIAPDGHFVYVNRAWRETLGYEDTEVNTITIFDVIHPTFQTNFQELFESVLSGEKLDQLVAELIDKNGEKIWVEGRMSCKFSMDKPVAVVAIFRDITARLKSEAALHRQQKQTERLLLNILPRAIAEQLKTLNTDGQFEHTVIAENFANVTVLFADIVGFTEITATLSPIALVELLNEIFSTFDRLSERHGLEKIKTIGDAYMVVGGMPELRDDHAEAIAEMALDMLTAIAIFSQQRQQTFRMRIGIHTGPVVAGVIGIKKFIYDLWGDTVNIASRMESQGLAGQIQVSTSTYKLLKQKYRFQERGAIQVKGKGEMITYLLTDRHSSLP